MRINVVRLLAVLALLCALSPSAVRAQEPCRFVLGFADLAAQLGSAVVGTCIENQRTITGAESFAFGSGSTIQAIEFPGGTSVQRTSRGVLSWSPQTNGTQFTDGTVLYSLDTSGVSSQRWANLLAPAATPTPVPPIVQAQRDAGADCFLFVTNIRGGVSLNRNPAEEERRKAEGDAAIYLCGQAVDRDGARGFECFVEAWDAARGMERVFAGSGQRVYQEKYAACIQR